MKDFLGKEIHIGDRLVYCRGRKNGFDLFKYEVVDFTPKMIRGKHIDFKTRDYDLLKPVNCIVYEKAAEDDIFPSIPDVEYVTETFTDLKYR